MVGETLDIKTLENWLWEAACKVRGEVDAAKYRDYILPLIFLKRLSDVFEDELAALAEEYGDKDAAEAIAKDDHDVVYVYVPPEARWGAIKKATTGVGEHLTNAVRAIARENPVLNGVIDIIDFNATTAGQRIISDDRLNLLIDVLGKHRLGRGDVEADILGRAYEYLLRKFAEGSGSSAGEFYTPPEVAILMAQILDPQPGDEIYDPTVGSGGLLIKSCLRFREMHGTGGSIKPIRCYGQEINYTTFAMTRMNMFIQEMEAEIRLGDTMLRPAFTTATGSLRQFDKVTANPMWNQDFAQSVYEKDPYERFKYGYPTSSSADWGWVQHMLASVKEDGKLAVVLDTGAVSRGSGNVGKNRERDIRKEFVNNDWVEAVILMPENLFYNTPAQGIILVINKAKRKADEIMIINASPLFKKGRPKNFLPEESVARIGTLYLDWKEEEGISTIITKDEVTKNDYNLSPSRYVAEDNSEEVLPLDEAAVQLRETEMERTKADAKLRDALKQLGLDI